MAHGAPALVLTVVDMLTIIPVLQMLPVRKEDMTRTPVPAAAITRSPFLPKDTVTIRPTVRIPTRNTTIPKAAITVVTHLPTTKAIICLMDRGRIIVQHSTDAVKAAITVVTVAMITQATHLATAPGRTTAIHSTAEP